MTTDDERPEVIPSPTDPEIDCVRIDGPIAAAPPGGGGFPGAEAEFSGAGAEFSGAGAEFAGAGAEFAAAGAGADLAAAGGGPCPEGYLPRRRRRSYELDGKRVVTGRPPEENPTPPPERPRPE